MANVTRGMLIMSSKPYERFDEMQLPWGNSICEEGGCYTEFQRNMMNGINFMRLESEPVGRKEFDKKFPMVATTDVSRWILNNIERIRIVPKGSSRIESKGYLGHSMTESERVFDNCYGMTDVVFYIEYDETEMKFTPIFNAFALNVNIGRQAMLKRSIEAEDLHPYSEDYEDRVEMFRYLQRTGVLDEMEFVPIKVIPIGRLSISHKAYSDGFGRHKSVTAPYYGRAIRQDGNVMAGLGDWFERGGKINDRNKYLILATKEDRSKYYLKRWEE